MKKAKKFIGLFLLPILIFCGISFPTEAVSYKIPFEAASQAIYLVNTDTGSVIYEQNADQIQYPASLTKIMTAILAIEAVPDLAGTMVTAPSYVYDELYLTGASTADIRQGETLSMEDLLYALLLPSACEAANIIADYVGNGSMDAFIAEMNQKALAIGAKDTHFVNAHGLYNPEQVTTARDMYLITQYALQYPIFEKITNTPSYKMPVTPRHPNDDWYIYHTNMLLRKNTNYYYEYAAGIKTGSTPESGRNLISTASKGGYHYMLVTMGAPYNNPDGSGTNLSFMDAVNLYEWAFDSFAFQTVMHENDVIDEIHVALSGDQDYVALVAEKDVTALLPAETAPSAIQQTITLRENVKAPVRQGDLLGKVELRLAGDVLATVNLTAMNDVERSPWLYALDVTGRFFSQPSVHLMLAALLLCILLYAIFLARYKRFRRRQRERQRKTLR